MKKISFIITGAILSIFSFFQPATVEASSNLKNAFGSSSTLEQAGMQSGFLLTATVETMSGKIITSILSLLGIIFILFTIYGGFLYMTASGNEEKTKKALSIIKQALIGLIIILAAYAITYLIFKFFV